MDKDWIFVRSIHDHYTIAKLPDGGDAGKFILCFTRRGSLPMLVRETAELCERAADDHYAERKLRNFSNWNLESGYLSPDRGGI